jgi:hypothetical protein
MSGHQPVGTTRNRPPFVDLCSEYFESHRKGCAIVKTLDTSDHRALRVYLTADDYGLPEGEEYVPKGTISKDVWRSLTSLPDNAALHTTDSYSAAVETAHAIAYAWLDIHDCVPEGSPIRTQCLAVQQGFEGSLFNAIHGWYRVAGITLRSAFEDMLIGMHYQRQKVRWPEFEQVVTGKMRSPNRRATNTELLKYISSDLLDQANALYQDELSVYVHRTSEGELWESNGPIFRQEALEVWIGQFDRTFCLLCEMIDSVVPGADAMNVAKGLRFKTWPSVHAGKK